MSKTRLKICYGTLVILLGLAGLACLPVGQAWGNGIVVTNVTIKSGAPAGYCDVQFDISWSNSWREVCTNASPSVVVTNWDAAWVFIKFKTPPVDEWFSATLATDGHTVPGGVTIDTPSDKMGVFIYRSAEGAGDVNYTGVRLRWNYAVNGVSNTNLVDISVQAIEMVYVAEGAFWAGNTNGIISSSFHAQGNDNSPAYIASTNAFTIYWGTGDGNNAAIASAFPKGYAPFYCMKYEITQGQYTDFLNKLTSAQAVNRYPGMSGSSRHTISGTWPNFTNTAPDRACNYLSWGDGAWYANWAGLRPMTELEFEKACRGPAMPVALEYAWGDCVIVPQTGHSGSPPDGSGSETAMPAGANCNYNSGISGPVRVGIYATTNSTRGAAGAGYYGVMELSGNLSERPVTVGKTDGRSFTGTHGTGNMTTLPTSWPNDVTASGAGLRGGDWSFGATFARASDRIYAADNYATRLSFIGWRGVRTAP